MFPRICGLTARDSGSSLPEQNPIAEKPEMSESTNQPPERPDMEAVARIAYEHLLATRENDASTYPLYLQKVRFLMTVVMVLFASLAFALSRISWALTDDNRIALVLLVVIGGAAALTLLLAFGCGVRCQHVRDSAVVGVGRLREMIESEEIHQMTPEHMYVDVSANIAGAIIDNRETDRKRAHWAVALNWTTLAGFVLTAIFVGYTVAGDVVSQRQAALERSAIMNKEAPKPADSDNRPTIVQLPDHIQADYKPSNPNVEAPKPKDPKQ
ncbi:MAG: hypothetical protein KF817_04565 [Phycisphaeraceae bacterium]|nr:hypothetical protein [Phycisphaeraceae bacterium]